MNPQIVIGANYGDEGKGLITDYLVREQEAVTVCRFNGGAQAGHTVQLPDGTRHVFHHFGSGTLAGATTYLSHHFICNPHTYLEELALLVKLGNVYPFVAANPACYVTTPYDMVLNHTAEYARESRHGSVGLGINETIERNIQGRAFGMRLDFLSRNGVEATRAKLRSIAKEWVPIRLEQLGVPKDSPHYKEAISFSSSPGVAEFALGQLEQFLSTVVIVGYEFLTGQMRGDSCPIIFEGAQGLALDQHNLDDFPYLTRSNTGLSNALDVIDIAGLPRPTVYYVTRTYLSRHGAGPLPGETTEGFENLNDPTNVKHAFQGSIRYAPLDIVGMSRRIARDLVPHMDRVRDLGLAVTWADAGVTELTAQDIAEQAAMTAKLCSDGPTHSHVTRLQSPT